jgi:hypothetical protein
MYKTKKTKNGNSYQCDECGAFYTCKWCGGTVFEQVPAGKICVTCGTLAGLGNAEFHHDWSKHPARRCLWCNKVFRSEWDLHIHEEEDHWYWAVYRRNRY